MISDLREESLPNWIAIPSQEVKGTRFTPFNQRYAIILELASSVRWG